MKTVLRKAAKIQKEWRLAGGRPVLLEVRSRELRMSASRRLRQRTDWKKAQKSETENIKENIQEQTRTSRVRCDKELS